MAGQAIKRASLGTAHQADRQKLVQLGFAEYGPEDTHTGLHDFKLTDAGRAFDDAVNVYKDDPLAEQLMRDAYIQVPATQALIQGLHGRGAVSVDGAHHMLARHGLADPRDVSGFRTMLSVLNSLGLVVYSPKLQTVRIESLPATDETAPVKVRIVQADRPYSNVKHLRETLRAARGFIWWVDPHFERRGFEPLLEEADASKVKQIRILATKRPSPTEVTDHKRFKTEMANLGIEVEYRIVPERDSPIHDRYIIDRDSAWNVPPLATILGKGKYSEFTRAQQRPPFEMWWQQGKPVEDL